MTLLRLLLIDPHAKFRESARKYLLRCREFRSVEVAASYNEGLLLYAQYFPSLILVDNEYLSRSPQFIKDLEKLKHSGPKLDVLALVLFRDDDFSRCQLFPHLVSGVIFKENFSENLLAYLSVRQISPAGRKSSFGEGVD